MLSKTSHRDVFDGQSVRPPGTGPAGFSAPNGCRRLSPKDPPSLVQGAALGAGRRASFFLFVSQKERSKEKAPFGKAFRSLRGATKGAAFGNCKPLKRLDRNFTGLRPLCKKRAFPSKPPPGGQGGTWGDWSPREAQRSPLGRISGPLGLPGPSAEGPCAGRVGRDTGGTPEGVTPAARRWDVFESSRARVFSFTFLKIPATAWSPGRFCVIMAP